MSKFNEVFNEFYGNVATNSQYETYRQVRNTDYNQLIQDVDKFKMSDLGTPVLDYVELILEKDIWVKKKPVREAAYTSNKAKKFIKEAGRKMYNQTLDNSINPLALHINNVEVVVTQASNIIRTSINGMQGTFKELYSKGDYNISLTGQLTGLTSLQDDMKNLNNFKRIYENTLNDKILIRSRFINGFGIENVVIGDYSMSLNKEYSNVIDFTITLESDKELEIITKII